MKKLLSLFVFTIGSIWAQCTGATTTWSCPAGTTSAQLSTLISSASDGATATFAAGSYTWNSFVSFSNTKGITLKCATIGACNVAVTGTVLGMNGNLSGTNTKNYRISGFNFTGAGDFTFWFYGAGTLSSIRIDNNTFLNATADTTIIFFGENTTVANFYGVIDHNTFTSTGSISAFAIIGGTNNTALPSPFGGANNLFFEDNTITITSITNGGRGCTDGWGSDAVVWRYNTTTNCLVTQHGVVHSGGPINFELYNNSLIINSGGGAFVDCYRCFHHQGSGELIVYNNTFTAFSGKNVSAIDLTHYRAADPVTAGYNDPPGRCDGTKLIDGNRSPTGTYYGYPCWRQPGRDNSANLKPIYVWNNKWSDTLAKIDLDVSNPWSATAPSVNDHVAANRDYYNAVSASAQSSPTSPFDGTTGMGFGTLANRPTTCTTGAETGGGVGYWATDTNTLYRCSATNTWSTQYTAYTYPHPLVTASAGSSSATKGVCSAGIGKILCN